MTLALWLLIYLGIVFAIGRLFDVVLGWQTVRLVFYPGMLVAAGGRLLATLLAGQDKEKLDVMRASGPFRDPELPGGAVFRFAWAVGPFLTSLVAFMLAWHLLETPIEVGGRLPQLGFEASAIGQGTQTAGDFFNRMVSAVSNQELGDVRFWGFLYLGLALIVTSAPTRTDLASVAAFAGVVGLVSFGLQQAGIFVNAGGLYGGQFWLAFSLLVAFSLFALVVSGLALLPLYLLRRAKEDK